MKNLISIFIIVISLVTLSCTHKDKTFYDNGNPKHILNYKGDLMEGEQKWYFKNGKLQSIFHYKKGVPDGVAIEYNIGGTKISESFFQKGKLNGQKKNFSDNGSLVSIETYKDGIKEGLYKKYHQNGKPMIEGYFKNDQFDSTWKYFDRFGIIIGQGIFKNGKGKLTSWFPNGKIMRTTNYIESKKNGKELIYDKSGALISEINYHNGNILK